MAPNFELTTLQRKYKRLSFIVYFQVFGICALVLMSADLDFLQRFDQLIGNRVEAFEMQTTNLHVNGQLFLNGFPVSTNDLAVVQSREKEYFEYPRVPYDEEFVKWGTPSKGAPPWTHAYHYSNGYMSIPTLVGPDLFQPAANIKELRNWRLRTQWIAKDMRSTDPYISCDPLMVYPKLYIGGGDEHFLIEGTKGLIFYIKEQDTVQVWP